MKNLKKVFPVLSIIVLFLICTTTASAQFRVKKIGGQPQDPGDPVAVESCISTSFLTVGFYNSSNKVYTNIQMHVILTGKNGGYLNQMVYLGNGGSQTINLPSTFQEGYGTLTVYIYYNMPSSSQFGTPPSSAPSESHIGIPVEICNLETGGGNDGEGDGN